MYTHRSQGLLIVYLLENENEDAATEVKGDVYGDIMEDLELTTIENPYYGDSIELSEQTFGGNGNIRTNNNTERITTTTNIYYDMDDTEISSPRTTIVTATQNVYYE